MQGHDVPRTAKMYIYIQEENLVLSAADTIGDLERLWLNLARTLEQQQQLVLYACSLYGFGALGAFLRVLLRLLAHGCCYTLARIFRMLNYHPLKFRPARLV